jgi:NADP-dependent aldehyde dehydrogenase
VNDESGFWKMATLSGRSIIGFRDGAGTGERFYASIPATGDRGETGFLPATAEETDLAVRLASDAFADFRKTSARERGAFLRRIAAQLDAHVDELVESAARETGLPKPRFQGETARTTGQLCMFAEVIE